MMFSQNPSTVFEIENILVDACGGTVEGENEMVAFHIGPYNLYTSNLSVCGAGSNGVIASNKWPNTSNLWLGLTQNSTTISKVAQINATIIGCGLFKEPIAGLLPAGAKVLLITSTSFNTAVTDFSGINDTVYVIFQTSGNTSGHFVNYNSAATPRTLVLRFAGAHPYADTVIYRADRLITQGGVLGAEDGASVSYTWAGVPTYYNDGCSAPVNTSINITANPNTPVCAGSVINFTSSIVNPYPNLAYVWRVNGIVVGANSPSYTSNTLNNNDVVSCYLINSQCNLSDTAFSNLITITISTSPSVTINPSNPSICSGNSVNITASGANTYSWSPPTGLNTTSGANVIASPIVNTTYTVTGFSSGCSDTATVVVSINSALNIGIVSSRSIPICSGDTIILTSSGADTYLWSPSTALNTNTGNTVIANPSVTTTYTVIGSSSGCTGSDDFIVTVNPLPQVVYAIPQGVCVSETSLILSGGSPTGGVYSGNAVSNNTFSPSDAGVGSYNITYSYSDANNCTNSASTMLQVFPLPNADFTMSPNFGVPSFPISFSSTYTNTPSVWYWDFADGNITSLTQPTTTHSYDNNGIYNVIHRVVDVNGCESTVTHNIEVVEINIPNAISPNGDDYNECFVINGISNSLQGIKLSIFNRWGKKIYESNNYHNDWNSNGSAAGVYYFLLSFPNDIIPSMSGSITIIR